MIRTTFNMPAWLGAWVLGCVAAAAIPASAQDAWSVFETRCLVPYEHIALPDTRGLVVDEEQLWSGAAYPLRLTEDSCAVLGPTDTPLAQALAGRQAYEEVAPGIWQSHLWREPRIELEAAADGYVVRETDLES
ncbi:MAG: hypothetical protein AAFY65_09180 [Pseudomonadota bacterium]